MNFNSMELVGLIAGFCTTFSFLPQIIRTWRTKSVEDISLRMYLMLSFGIMLWLLYGINMKSLSLIFTNSVSLLLTSAILVMKIVYGRRARRNPADLP